MALSHKNVLLILTTMALVVPIYGFRLFPFIQYHLCMMNGFKANELSLQCYHHNPKPDKVDLHLIPAHGSYNWTFHPEVDKVKTYFCDARWGKKGAPGGICIFQAFADETQFIDEECGGRHCVWMYNETGLYIHNVHSNMYRYQYEWHPLP